MICKAQAVIFLSERSVEQQSFVAVFADEEVAELSEFRGEIFFRLRHAARVGTADIGLGDSRKKRL